MIWVDLDTSLEWVIFLVSTLALILVDSDMSLEWVIFLVSTLLLCVHLKVVPWLQMVKTVSQ